MNSSIEPLPSPIPGLSQAAFGYLTVAISVLAFGSFNIPLKLERVRKEDIDPMIFQIYLNITIFISSFIVLGWTPFVLTPWGLLSATLWVSCSLLSIFAIKNIGLAVSQGVWAGCTMIVSFIWGAAIFHQTPKNIPLSLVGLGLLVVGIGSMSVAGSDLLGKKLYKFKEKAMVDPAKYSPIGGEGGEGVGVGVGAGAGAGVGVGMDQPNSGKKKKNKFFGFLCAVGVGIPNGSMLAPLNFSNRDEGIGGIDFLVSFGVGVLAITPLFAFLYFLYFRKAPLSLFKPKLFLLPGMIAGITWNIGNAGSIYAQQYLGIAVGFPLTQCALLIAGMWGILIFKEIKGFQRVLLWAVGAAILVGGAVLLGLYGQH